MHLFKAATAIVICAAMATLSGKAGAASLLTNGDFEAGNTGFTTDFSLQPVITSAGTYIITDNPQNNHGSAASYGDHTSGAGLMMAVNGTTTSGDVFWRQTVSVAAGADYEFSMFSSAWYPGSSLLGLVINGVSVGTALTPSTVAIWAPMLFPNWSSGGATSATLELQNLSAGSSGNDFAIDDLSFVEVSAAVPLPAGLPLLLAGLGAFGILRSAKRAKA